MGSEEYYRCDLHIFGRSGGQHNFGHLSSHIQGLEGSTCLARGFGKVTGLGNGADYDWPRYVQSEQNGGDTMKRSTIILLVLAVLVAAWVIYHRVHADLHATPVTTTITIPLIDDTWAPPPPGAAPAMTPGQAWLTYMHIGEGQGMIRAKVQLGLILNQLAYGYYWTACAPGTNLPATNCWNWLFLDANTGHVIAGTSYNARGGPGP